MDTQDTSRTLPAEFLRLSPQVQIFVVKYLANGGDKLDAVSISHPNCKNPHVLSCQILSRARVRRVIDAYQQRSSIDVTLAELKQGQKKILKLLERLAVKKESNA